MATPTRETPPSSLFIRDARAPNNIPRETAILGLKMLCLNTASEMRFRGRSEEEILAEVKRIWAKGRR